MTILPKGRGRPWAIAGIVIASVLVVVIAVAAYYANRIEPIAREKIVEYLEERFDSDVELRDLRVRLFPRVNIRGRGVKFRLKRRTDIPPLIDLGEFSFNLDWAELTSPTKHISVVRLKDFELNMPPKSDTPREAAPGERVDLEPKTVDKPKPKPGSVVIDQLIADKTTLRILPRDPERPVGTFELYELRLLGVGAGRPMTFRTHMKNYKPPGMIDCTGSFGPWVTGDPGETPLNGDYVYDKADLGVFSGIAGIMYAKGHFEGRLQYMDVTGTADVPDFQLRYAGNKVPLKTKYVAVVDGTSGNTFLTRVDAILGQTPMLISGDVAGEKGVKGKEIVLDAVIKDGRLEDVLNLAVKGGTPMRGRIDLKTKILVPRGDVNVIEKIGLDGKFTMAGVRFTGREIQEKIDELSRKASRAPEETVAKAKSSFDAGFTVKDSLVTIRNLTYGVPGVEIDLDGTYGMRTEAMNFDGVLRLDAKASQMFSGFKSVLLKPFDGLVSRKNKGTVISIKVEGTRDHPKFGVDMGRTLKKKDD